jgi:hypothetical protein
MSRQSFFNLILKLHSGKKGKEDVLCAMEVASPDDFLRSGHEISCETPSGVTLSRVISTVQERQILILVGFLTC